MAFRLLTDKDRQMARQAIASGKASPEEKEDWSQQLADFELGIDITPYSPKWDQEKVGYINPDSPTAQNPSRYSAKQREAASRGLDIDTGVPFHIEFGAQFANNENEKIEWYKKALAKEHGQEVTVMASKDFPDQYEYLLPSKDGPKRRVLIGNNTGYNAGGLVGSFAGSPAETTLGVGGALAGTMLGGGIPGGVVGAGGGSALGAVIDTPLRNVIGREVFGINQPANTKEGRDVQAKQLMNRAEKNALIAGGTSLATDTVSLGNRFIRYWFKGLAPLNPAVAKSLLDNAEAGYALVRELNQFAGDKPFKVSIPAAATTPTANARHGVIDFVPTPYAKEAMGLESQVLRDQDLGAELRSYHEEANEALLDIYDNVNKKTVAARPAGSAYEAGSPLLAAARDERALVESYAEMDVANEEQKVRDFITNNFPNMPEPQLVHEVRKAMSEGHKYWKNNEKQLWDIWEKQFYDDSGRFQEVLLPVDEQFALFLRNDEGKKFYRLFKDSPLVKGMNLSPNAPLSPEDLKARQRLGLNQGDVEQTQVVGLHGLTDDIKHFRARLRQAEKASGFTLSEAEKKDIEAELRSFRDRALAAAGRDDLKRKLGLAEQASLIKAERYNQGIPLKALGKKRDTFTSKDITVLADILRYKDVDAYKQFVRVMKDAPGGPQKMRELFLGAYQAEALDAQTGLPTPAKHAAFMKKYGWALEEWIPGGGLIDDMKTFANKVTAGRKEFQRFDDMYAARFGRIFKKGKLENLDAATLVAGVWDGSLQGEDLITMLNFAKTIDARQGSALTERWRAGVLQSLRDKILVGGKLNSKAMEEILEKRSFELKTLFGHDYINNYNKVLQGLKMSELAGAAPVNPKVEKTWFEYLGRVLWAPPMTREGRLMTLGTFFRTSSYKQSVADIFTSPAALREMAEFSQKRLSEQAWTNVMSRVMAVAAVDKNDEE